MGQWWRAQNKQTNKQMNHFEMYTFESFASWLGFKLHIIKGTEKQKHFVWRVCRAEKVKTCNTLIWAQSIKDCFFTNRFLTTIQLCKSLLGTGLRPPAQKNCTEGENAPGFDSKRLNAAYVKSPLDMFWSYSSVCLLAQPEMKHNTISKRPCDRKSTHVSHL